MNPNSGYSVWLLGLALSNFLFSKVLAKRAGRELWFQGQIPTWHTSLIKTLTYLALRLYLDKLTPSQAPVLTVFRNKKTLTLPTVSFCLSTRKSRCGRRRGYT